MLGSKIGCAYDVGCAFQSTLDRSSLGDRARTSQLRLMVGAFHGHAHNRSCQLRWHPTYIKGTGRTEGEGCEHVFSSSNDLARATRHASRFHRHQMIEEHFAFWDEDKYANLSAYAPTLLYKYPYHSQVSSWEIITELLSMLSKVLKPSYRFFRLN